MKGSSGEAPNELEDGFSELPTNLPPTVKIVKILKSYLRFCAFIFVLIIFLQLQGVSSLPLLLEAVKCFLLLVGAGFVTFAGYYQYKAIAINIEWTKFNREKEKKLYSLKLLSGWDFEKVKLYREMEKERKKRPETDIAEFIDGNEAHRLCIVNIMNFFEDVEQAIANGVADEAILKRGFHNLLYTINDIYKPWFAKIEGEKRIVGIYNNSEPFFALLNKWNIQK